VCAALAEDYVSGDDILFFMSEKGLDLVKWR
jgi:hypothetical protein